MASDERRAVAQSDLDALVAACERLYEGLGFDATVWNNALAAVRNSPPYGFEEVAVWCNVHQGVVVDDDLGVCDMNATDSDRYDCSLEPIFVRVTEATAPSRADQQ